MLLNRGSRGAFGALMRQRSTRLSSASTRSAATDTTNKTQSSPSPNKGLSGAEIRERFLSFYESKGHARLPSSSLVPEDPTVLLTIAGMLQFKPIFLGQAPKKVPRATTTQKCVRTNDIENVGVTARHHTFFEMLGNFSFGDYFKREAISYAWELSTKVFGLPPERVWVSVYEEDDEAFAIWRDSIGVPPERIKRMGAADNFWASGPTGPCGPCSELYYDFHPLRGTDPSVTLEDDTRFIEFYNLVFMEMNRNVNGQLEPLAAKNIDTGMGLERMAQILQGVSNNYETDIIFPIVEKAAQLAKVDYHKSDNQTKTALKVIGDHIRAVAYLISDGVTPSNVGRGYIVRRLLRRVVMKGRLLGIKEVFTSKVAQVAVSLSGPCDPQLAVNAQRVYEVLAAEEGAFATTLEKGQKILDELLSKALSSQDKSISGSDAFLLYDTFGFPLELTQEIAEQKGVSVDESGFESEMESQRKRSKDSREEVDMTAGASSDLASLAASSGPTDFVGYSLLQADATVLALIDPSTGSRLDRVTIGSKVDLVLDRTPFYAESGGQVADKGLLVIIPQASTTPASSAPGLAIEVGAVKKAAGGSLFVHAAQILPLSVSSQEGGEGGGDQEGLVLKVGDRVSARVDAALRRRSAAHHTATHLLQSALKKVLGPDVTQQGSLVGFDRLRFDFNLSHPMAQEEVMEVERLVNLWVNEASPLSTKVMGLKEARAAGAVAMFGEKYEDVVRVVDVPGVSMELCGGTHVTNTAEIGAFKVISESGIASGVRRIEAVAGSASVDLLNSIDSIVRSVATTLKVKSDEVPAKVIGLQAELKGAAKEIADLRSQLAIAKSRSLLSQAVQGQKGLGRYLVAELEGVEDPKAAQEAGIQLQAALGDDAAVLLGTRSDGGEGGKKASFVAVFGPKAIAAGIQAGKVVGAVAKVCGGGGGGKPGLAQAGGKDGAKFEEAMDLARTTLASAL